MKVDLVALVGSPLEVNLPETGLVQKAFHLLQANPELREAFAPVTQEVVNAPAPDRQEPDVQENTPEYTNRPSPPGQ